MAALANACEHIVPVGVLTQERICNDGFNLQARISPHNWVSNSTLNLSVSVKRRDPGVASSRIVRTHRPKKKFYAYGANTGPRAASREEGPYRQLEESDQVVRSSLVSSSLSSQPSNTLAGALRSYFNEVRTGWELILKHPDPAQALGQVLAKEWKMIYLTTCNDFSAAVLPYWCTGINVLAVSPFLQTGDFDHFWLQAATTMSKEVSYSFLSLYCFNLANQFTGAAGDAIDKPWRPIPSKLITIESALARCLLANLLFSFASWHLGVLHWTLVWQCVIASQFRGYEKDTASGGLGRSIAMWIGTVVICSAGVSLATPMTSALQIWAVTRGAVVGNHHWVQDFRDVEGDRQIGRTTFPLKFGVEKARRIMAFIFLMDPIFLHFVVMKDSGYTMPQLIAEGFGVLLSTALAYRVMNFKAPAEDHDTYTIWLSTYYHNFSFLVIGPAFIGLLN